MIGILYVLLEALAVILCLHALYGKKFAFDKYTAIFIVSDCVLMISIWVFKWSQIVSMVVYVMILIYCLLEFGRDIKSLFVNLILLAIIIICVQVVVSMIFFVMHILSFANESMRVSAVNFIVFVLMGLLYKKSNMHKISLFLQRKEVLIAITFVLECGALIAILINAKKFNGVFPKKYIVMIIFLIFIAVLCLNAMLYKAKYKEKQSELDAYKTYSLVFEELITDIRIKQHEFDNHVNALCNLHYVCTDYDELVKEQSQYAKDVVNDNKFNKLLSSGNPVLSGFLYGRLRSMENMGINVTYKLCVKELPAKVPAYIIIELIGNLLNNAAEALQKGNSLKKLHIECVEEEKYNSIIVRNTSEYITYKEIEKFFERGYSSKGEKRGLGLYHVKEVCDKYNIDILCENRLIDELNWIAFELRIKKQ